MAWGWDGAELGATVRALFLGSGELEPGLKQQQGREPRRGGTHKADSLCPGAGVVRRAGAEGRRVWACWPSLSAEAGAGPSCSVIPWLVSCSPTVGLGGACVPFVRLIRSRSCSHVALPGPVDLAAQGPNPAVSGLWVQRGETLCGHAGAPDWQ